MVKKGAEERTKTFWFRNLWLFGPRNLQSALNEMFFLPLFLVSFFFFCRTFTCRGKTPVLPCWSNTSSAQGASGKRGPDLLSLFERRWRWLQPRYQVRGSKAKVSRNREERSTLSASGAPNEPGKLYPCWLLIIWVSLQHICSKGGSSKHIPSDLT